MQCRLRIRIDLLQQGLRHGKRNDLDGGDHLPGFHARMIAQRRDGNPRIMCIDRVDTADIGGKHAVVPCMQVDPPGCGIPDFHLSGGKRASDHQCSLILADIALFQTRGQNRTYARPSQQSQIGGIKNRTFAQSERACRHRIAENCTFGVIKRHFGKYHFFPNSLTLSSIEHNPTGMKA